jgi:hypothetical protein
MLVVLFADIPGPEDGEFWSMLRWFIIATWAIGVMVTLAWWPKVHFAVYHDSIHINYGLGYIFKFRLPVADIVKITDATKWSLIERRNWARLRTRGLTVRNDKGALAIETKNKKYLVSCPDPTEAIRIMGKVFPSGILESPPLEETEFKTGYWTDKTAAEPVDREVKPWRPGSRAPMDPSMQPVEPVWEFSETWKFLAWMFGIYMPFMIIIPIFILLFAPRGLDIFDKLLFIIPLVIFSIIIVTIFGRVAFPHLRLKVYQDRIDIFWGVLFPLKFTIDVSSIEAVQVAICDPQVSFGTTHGVRKGKDDWLGWQGIFVVVNNRGLAIMTGEKNYIIGCTDPEKLSRELKQALGGQEIEQEQSEDYY